ncbi:hypothetical protein JCM8097_006368 [Rhodosporidiobolus ruineniae]
MLATLSTPIRSRCSTSHDNPAVCARAAAELCALDLLLSMSRLLKVHTRKEAEDEQEQQLERMHCVTYAAPPPTPPALTPP